MKKKSFADIYKRNVKGTFLNGFSLVHIYPIGALFALIHLALLPLTLTLGAVIKSLIDFFSRKEIAEKALNHAEKEIDRLDAETIVPLIDEIYKYELQARSNSSKNLIENLKKQSTEERAGLSLGVGEKKRSFALEELTAFDPNLPIAVTKEYIWEKKLTPEHEELLETFKTTKAAELADSKFKAQKQAIIDYFTASHNTGKQLQHNICSFFCLEASRGNVANSELSESVDYSKQISGV